MTEGISFIIPHRDGECIQKTVDSVKNAAAGLCRYEIIESTGNSPTIQRNASIRRAAFDILYFLDNDSLLSANSLSELFLAMNQYPEAEVFGGPNIPGPDDSFLQNELSSVLSSCLIAGKISARYAGRGRLRLTCGRELILCNLAVKKKCFSDIGLFNELLYPNEENEFLHRAHQRGKIMIYNPRQTVEKGQRSSISEYIRQMLSYGRGRGEQTGISPTSFSLFFFMPVLYFFYLCALPAAVLWILIFSPYRILAVICALPFFLHVFYSFTAWILAMFEAKKIFFFFPLLAGMAHVLYGAGIISALLSKKFKSQGKNPQYFIRVLEP